MAEAAPTIGEWGRFRGIRPSGGLHTTDTRAAGWLDAGEAKCVRTMNHVHARACVRERGRRRNRAEERDIGARYTSVTM